VELVNACREDESLGSVTLQDAALSTSASYERFWEIGGKRYSHILDPRTGWPTEPLASVTVIAPTATESDALSTAVYVAGMEEGRSLLERAGLDGILVDKEAGAGCTPFVVRGSGKSLEFSYASIGASNGN
jgi:thiamine biosynthesis lipoprotein